MPFDPNSPTSRVLQPSSILDGVNGTHLCQTVTEFVASGVRTVLLDCRDVTFINSTGFRSLVECHQTLQQAGGELLLSNLNESVHGLLLLTGLDAVLTVL